MENASTANDPAYIPVDAHDLHVALTQIDRRLEKVYPGRLGRRALLGYSMGGFETLYLAANESKNEPSLVPFDRYVAINAPVRLLYGISKLDEFFDAPLAWPENDRTNNIENTFLKVAAMAKNSLTPQASLPFSGIESRFIIGVAFRLILRDAIFSSQRRHNQGILKQPIRNLRRTPVYKEILQYSYQDYLQKFLVPYYSSCGIDLEARGALDKAADLRTYAAGLQANDKIRLMVNRNDFLLPDEDFQWLQSTLPPGELKVFEEGGHLGNLSNPMVQQAILTALEGLR